MSNLTAFLRENGPDCLAKLEKNFSITASRHKTIPNLILFKYDQLKSKMTNPIVQECRGIILDEAQDWKIISFPYTKFFNMNEIGKTPEIGWKNQVRAYEKIDGSLATLYFFEGSWNVATSGSPDASGPVHSRSTAGADNIEENEDENETQISISKSREITDNDNNIFTNIGPTRKTFSQLFWEVFHLLDYKLPVGEDIHKCYMFELATPQNRVVVPYHEPKLYLHGVRDLIDLNEELPDPFSVKYGWELAPFKIIEGEKSGFDLNFLPAVASLDGLKQEGYVICDSHFNRFKLKCPMYLNLSLLKTKDGHLTWKRLVGIVQVNEGSEFLAYYPQCTDLYNQIYERYQLVINELQATQNKYAHLQERELQDAYKTLPKWMRAYLFMAKKFKLDFKEYFSNKLRYNSLCNLLDPSKPAPDIPI